MAQNGRKADKRFSPGTSPTWTKSPSLVKKGDQHGIIMGHKNSTFIFLLGSHGNGQKLQPMALFEKKVLPKKNFQGGIIIKVNQKGWMDEQKMKEWH